SQIHQLTCHHRLSPGSEYLTVVKLRCCNLLAAHLLQDNPLRAFRDAARDAARDAWETLTCLPAHSSGGGSGCDARSNPSPGDTARVDTPAEGAASAAMAAFTAGDSARGGSSPARYSWKRRRYMWVWNRSSKAWAYRSSGTTIGWLPSHTLR